ncbi:YfbU family protein [Tabrizicola aquatica]|uniref:YfbU family protein n=1 Tax=Tabrizicola aquatica TaxID=909926 RepID=UPI000CD0AF38|nr:YfbU family protein [Tabrizicola aquatica]
MKSQFNNFERLTLVMQASASVGSNYFVDPKLVGELITSGQDWALSWEYEWLEKAVHPLDEVVEETRRIFEMYRHLQSSADTLGMDKKLTNFSGFDHNNDAHSGVADTLVNKLGRFTDLRGATQNSHSSASIRNYRTMLEVYEPIIEKMRTTWPGGFRMLDAGEIDAVLAAR